MEKLDARDSHRQFPPKIRGSGRKGSDSSENYNTIYETYWRTADLTGKDLIVRPPEPPYDKEYYRDVTNISFIRLEPATSGDLELMHGLKSSSETNILVAIWCSGALSGHTRGHEMYHPESSQWFEEDFEAYRNGDFGIFCMEAIRGNLCLFKTEHGDVGSLDGSWAENWVDPLSEFTRLAHANDMKLFVGTRLIGGGRPVAFNPINWARFFWENLQWAKRDKEGNLCSNLSLAYEGVRKHWLALMREALDYGTDGIVLYFNRCMPYVMYEEPVVDAFIKLHEIDPRELPEDDERWQRHVSGYVTQFVSETRALLDEKPGRELAICGFRGMTEFKPGTIKDGCDPDSWIREGLVDYLWPDYSTTTEYFRHWKELSGGRVKVYGDLMPRRQPGEEMVKLAKSLYADGADGLCLWDVERRIQRASEWALARHLGHKEHLDHLAAEANDYYRFNDIRFHRGLNVNYAYRDG